MSIEFTKDYPVDFRVKIKHWYITHDDILNRSEYEIDFDVFMIVNSKTVLLDKDKHPDIYADFEDAAIKELDVYLDDAGIDALAGFEALPA